MGESRMADGVEGSGVFADLEVADGETHRVKAELVRRVAALITQRGLTQVAAAALLGLSQSDVSKVLRGQPPPLSLERLMRCLMAMGQSVAIDVGPAKQTRPSIRMTVR
jgi:predicted XRE-type DNA-binding protein